LWTRESNGVTGMEVRQCARKPARGRSIRPTNLIKPTPIDHGRRQRDAVGEYSNQAHGRRAEGSRYAPSWELERSYSAVFIPSGLGKSWQLILDVRTQKSLELVSIFFLFTPRPSFRQVARIRPDPFGSPIPPSPSFELLHRPCGLRPRRVYRLAPRCAESDQPLAWRWPQA
jgi:hypothetical protein